MERSLRGGERGEAGSERVLLTDELLLRRDLLDSQVIDTDEIRMARVSDVFLGGSPTCSSTSYRAHSSRRSHAPFFYAMNAAITATATEPTPRRVRPGPPRWCP
jgi:hypothetical protein